MVSMGGHSVQGYRHVKHPLKRNLGASNFDYGEYLMGYCSCEHVPSNIINESILSGGKNLFRSYSYTSLGEFRVLTMWQSIV